MILALPLALYGLLSPSPLSSSISTTTTSRRAVLGHTLLGAASSLLPLPALAVAPPSPQQMLKSRAVYGSRVFRLQDATPATILDEKNVFTLFITGAFGSTADKSTRKALEKLEKAALAAAGKGDAAAAHAAIKEFIALGQITEMDMVKGTTFNQKTACDRAGLQCGLGYEGYVGSRMKD